MMDYRSDRQAFKCTGLERKKGAIMLQMFLFVMNHHIVMLSCPGQFPPLLEACCSISQPRNHHASFDRLNASNAKANRECFQSS